MLTEEELKYCDKMLQEDWQKEYNFAGSFQTSLMRTIEIADGINLRKIETVYPNLVKAYRSFAYGDSNL